MKDVASQKNPDLVVVIAPFPGNLQQLARTAAAQLANEGFCRILDIDKLCNNPPDTCDILLVEDGYTPSCRSRIEEGQLVVAHHLILNDLGLEEDAAVDEENINLIRDGIEAESIVIDSYTPKFNCPCCG